MVEERITELERRTEELAERLARVERWTGAVRPPRPAPPPAPRPSAPERVAPPVPAGATAGLGRLADRANAMSVEDLVGGRVLAWAGGAAVLVGLVLLFAVAVSRGWIGEGARILIAATGAFALGALGVWLQEHRGRTDAALAATATSAAGLFVTITVAAQVYEVVPALLALPAAMAVGAAATALAVRWRAQGIAALGLVGALLAPVLAGAPAGAGTLALLWVAAAAAAAVVVWQRWTWLAFVAFLITTAQWIAYLDTEPGRAAVVAALTAFGALNAAAALGYELRVGAARLRPSSSLLLALNALAIAVAGWSVLGGDAATIWVAALGVAHLALGAAALRSRRVAHEIGLLVCSLGVVLADVALALALDGAPRVVAYAGGAVAFAALAKWSGAPERAGAPADALDERVLGAGLGGHLCLAVLELLTGPARPDALVHAGSASTAATGALVAVAAACFAAATLAGSGRRSWQLALHAVALAAIAYLSALSLDGVALVFAWAGEGAALAGIAGRAQATDRREPVAVVGAAAFTALAAAHALVFEAPPTALVAGLPDIAAAAAALGAVGLAFLALAARQLGSPAESGAGRRDATAGVAFGRARPDDPRERAAALAAGAVTVLYLASTALISAFQPGEAAAARPLLELGVRQEGQVLLSALWALAGTVALVAGLRGDRRGLRLGALTLLLVALGKVAVYDLSALTSVYRVGSCIALGLLLLVAAFVWQRLRPRPLPDLRAMPPALR